MIIEGIKLHLAHIYGEMPSFDGQPSRNKAAVQAFHDETQPAALEYLSFLREYGPHAGKMMFKATSLHRCRVEVIGSMYKTLSEMLTLLDAANIDRNRIFTTGPVTLDIEPGVREEGVRTSGFIHLNRIIVDVDRLAITELLK
nr:MAG TPA: hypothetical protein [Caudoviricetes sp.]